MYSDRWPLWWRAWAWLRSQIVGDDLDPQYSQLDREDGLGR